MSTLEHDHTEDEANALQDTINAMPDHDNDASYPNLLIGEPPRKKPFVKIFLAFAGVLVLAVGGFAAYTVLMPTKQVVKKSKPQFSSPPPLPASSLPAPPPPGMLNDSVPVAAIDSPRLPGELKNMDASSNGNLLQGQVPATNVSSVTTTLPGASTTTTVKEVVNKPTDPFITELPIAVVKVKPEVTVKTVVTSTSSTSSKVKDVDAPVVLKEHKSIPIKNDVSVAVVTVKKKSKHSIANKSTKLHKKQKHVLTSPHKHEEPDNGYTRIF